MKIDLTLIRKLQDVLDVQDKKSVEQGGYDSLTYTVERDEEYNLVLKIIPLKIGFVFNETGRFMGAYNWKD